MLVKKTPQNRITLPKAVIKEFPDAEYFDVTVEGRKILLMPVKMTSAETAVESARKKIRKLGITQKDASDAVKWARKK